MRWLAALLLVVVSSCDFSVFNDQNAYPDDIPCSDQNTCPPNQVCVPGEHYCRYRCSNNSCPAGHNNGGGGLVCDIDRFCRVGCPGGGCQTGQTCDNAIATAVCRPPCGGTMTCGAGFTCELNTMQAGGCRPTP